MANYGPWTDTQPRAGPRLSIPSILKIIHCSSVIFMSSLPLISSYPMLDCQPIQTDSLKFNSNAPFFFLLTHLWHWRHPLCLIQQSTHSLVNSISITYDWHSNWILCYPWSLALMRLYFLTYSHFFLFEFYCMNVVVWVWASLAIS